MVGPGCGCAEWDRVVWWGGKSGTHVQYPVSCPLWPNDSLMRTPLECLTGIVVGRLRRRATPRRSIGDSKSSPANAIHAQNLGAGSISSSCVQEHRTEHAYRHHPSCMSLTREAPACKSKLSAWMMGSNKHLIHFRAPQFKRTARNAKDSS